MNIGSRQRGRERGANVIDVGYAQDDISAGIARALTLPRDGDALYGAGDAGGRIADALATLPLTTSKILAY